MQRGCLQDVPHAHPYSGAVRCPKQTLLKNEYLYYLFSIAAEDEENKGLKRVNSHVRNAIDELKLAQTWMFDTAKKAE